VGLEWITPKYIYSISMYVRTNRWYNERGSRANNVRSSIHHRTLICDSEEIIKQNWRYIHKNFYDMAKRFASNILKRLLFCDANVVLRTSEDSNLAPKVGYPKVYLVPAETFL